MEHQFHYDKKFYQDKKTGYWISTSCPKIRAHVWVWKYHNGDIKKGLHIHHKDEDKSNNDISNLEEITVKEHVAKHVTEERSAAKLLHIASIRPLTKKWHSSDAGIEWHRKHGLKTWEDRQPFNIECKQCGKKADTKIYHQDFCSNACKSSWRRKQGLDNEERECQICKLKFTVNKYAKTKTCSRSCGVVLRRQKC
jgi:hypothetical protein